jgi:hypothetical protein
MPPTNMSLSPPPSTSDGEILQHGLHHILQHNANSPYPQEQYQPDEAVHLQPNYGSPTPGPDEMYGYCDQQPRFIYQQQHQDSGLGMPYVGKLIYCMAEATDIAAGELQLGVPRISIPRPIQHVGDFTAYSIDEQP